MNALAMRRLLAPADPAVMASPSLLDAARGLTGASVMLSAVVHLDVWFGGFRSIATIGPLFLLQAISGLVLGLVVMTWRHWLTGVMAAGFGASTLIGFYLAVELPNGLFGFKEGQPTSWSAVTSEVSEYAAIGLGVLIAGMLGSSKARGRRP